MNDIEFFCPQCYKKAEFATHYWIKYSTAGLELPTFLCVDCHTAYIDWPVVKRKIRRWRNASKYAKAKISYFAVVIEIMQWHRENLEEFFIKRLGYREVKFLKRRKAKT
ncbi:MAG: hypothetical protein HYT98_00900 [Candidatus Sungbacteria bacterium]|nr:hypothetical protein [Candidatus Sungbacteria bacterium]